MAWKSCAKCGNDGVVGAQLSGGFDRASPRSNGGPDVRPAIFSVLFSLLLTTTLILMNSGDQLLVTETALALVDGSEAELVARDAASSFGARQGVSPALVVVGLDLSSQQSDGGDVSNSAQGAGVDGSGSEVSEDGGPDSTVATGEDNPKRGEGVDVVPTTTAREASAQPDAATTTQPSRVLPTVQALTGPLPIPGKAPTLPPATSAPTTTTTTTNPTTTTTTTTTTAVASASGRYTVAEIIDGTIGAGDGANPNEDGPNGRHDASLFLPQGWSWAQGTTRNDQWGNLGRNQFVEFRCAVIPQNGHTPPVDFRVNFKNGAYYQFAGESWSKAFDVAFDDPSHGAYLGIPGQVNNDPFASGRGAIEWRREADGSFSAPWNSDALMMHFWASERQSPTSGQIAEFLTSEMRLIQPDGRTVDLSEVRVLFQCGVDYYNTTGGQGTKVPGPGIGKYHMLTAEWQSGLWVTLPGGEPASSTADFRTWLGENLPPNVTG